MSCVNSTYYSNYHEFCALNRYALWKEDRQQTFQQINCRLGKMWRSSQKHLSRFDDFCSITTKILKMEHPQESIPQINRRLGEKWRLQKKVINARSCEEGEGRERKASAYYIDYFERHKSMEKKVRAKLNLMDPQEKNMVRKVFEYICNTEMAKAVVHDSESLYYTIKNKLDQFEKDIKWTEDFNKLFHETSSSTISIEDVKKWRTIIFETSPSNVSINVEDVMKKRYSRNYKHFDLFCRSIEKLHSKVLDSCIFECTSVSDKDIKIACIWIVDKYLNDYHYEHDEMSRFFNIPIRLMTLIESVILVKIINFDVRSYIEGDLHTPPF